MQGTTTELLLMLVLVTLSAFFSATETAYSSLNRARLKSLADRGQKRAADTLALADRYDELLSTILVGNNLVNIALASVGTVPGRRDLGETAFRQLWTLYNACQDVRRMGCASLDLSFVACGRQDLYVEPALKPWDYAAGLLLVEEAGGKVTQPDGSPVTLLEGCGVLASNGHVHQQALEALQL